MTSLDKNNFTNHWFAVFFYFVHKGRKNILFQLSLCRRNRAAPPFLRTAQLVASTELKIGGAKQRSAKLIENRRSQTTFSEAN